MNIENLFLSVHKAVLDKKIKLTDKLRSEFALYCARDCAEYIKWLLDNRDVDTLKGKLMYENFGNWESREDEELTQHILQMNLYKKYESELYSLLVSEIPSIELDNLFNCFICEPL